MVRQDEEFTVVFTTAVYVHPLANAYFITRQQNKQPEGIFIVAGDFSPSNLKTVLVRFHKDLDIKTRKSRILEQVHTNIPGANKTHPSYQLGQFDHLFLFLTPAYKPTNCPIHLLNSTTHSPLPFRKYKHICQDPVC